MGARRRARIAERQGIAAAAARLLAAAALLTAGCTTGGGGPPDPAEAERLLRALRAATPPPGAVVVRLAFGSAADFDLYVTGPLEETVYFANTPTRIGGRLLRDLRCDAPGPRIETVIFEHAPAGRFRVGVDLPERCDGRRGEAPFAVEIRAPGARAERAGHLAAGVFEPIVFEWTEGP